MPDYDLIFRHASIVDGSGRAAFEADLAVTGDRIAAIGDLSKATAAQTIDLTGKTLTPGFVDVHTHDDRAVAETDMLPKISQGVTTVVTGNCGISLAPIVASELKSPMDLIATESWLRFATFGAYMDELDGHALAVNSMPLVGHTTLRIHVLDDITHAADAGQCERMRELLDEAMASGAWGMSTGTYYPPAQAATTEEIVAVGEPLTRHGGMYVTHMRNEAERVIEALDESFLIGRELSIPVIISHHKVAGLANQGRSPETLAHICRAMEHQDIGLDCYPYNASSTMLHPDFLARASDVVVTWSKPHPEFAGKRLADVAKQWGCDDKTAAVRLQPAGAIYFIMDEADVQRILKFEQTMIGSDGLIHDPHPHPRLWGTFPRVLGHYARELGLFSFEKAVHKMSGLTATRLGLPERGLLAEGYFADLVVLDRENVIDRATFAQPATPSEGIESVYINGALAFSEGRVQQRNGRLLRHTSTAA